jgi:hypothetical protein
MSLLTRPASENQRINFHTSVLSRSVLSRSALSRSALSRSAVG